MLSISAKELAGLIRDKKISCVELMQDHLDHVAKVNPRINAIVEPLAPEKALDAARAADAVIAKNNPLGILHGVPVTIKQGRKVKGFPCNLGVRSHMNFIADEDATVVARLRAAGAIIIGVTNIPDFSMSYETDNALYGCTHNPYDLQRSPGGSSGGEAAIIAASGSYFGIGADSGGSIRQPAHNCGIVGLKPTRGLIPSTGKFPEDGLGIFSYIETQGPMARYVDDIIYTLPILSGADNRDADVCPVNLHDAVKLDSLRVKFYTGNGVALPSADICSAITKTVTALSPYVLSVTESYPVISKEMYSEFEELFFYGGDRGRWLRDRMEKMGVVDVSAPFQAILDRAAQCEFSVTELRRRLFEIDRFKFMMMDFMRDADVILCPVATQTAAVYPAPVVANSKLDLAYDLTYNLPYNIMGWPSVVIRCGTGSDGMPIGVQIVARAWREDVALAVGKWVEGFTDVGYP